MPDKQKSSKKQRAHKTSAGKNGGGGKVRNLTPVQLVNLGQGQYRTWKPLVKK